jgi:hypothetical protein
MRELLAQKIEMDVELKPKNSSKFNPTTRRANIIASLA